MLAMILADVADRDAADAVCKLISARGGVSAAVYTEQSRFPPDVAYAEAVVILCSPSSMQSTWLQRHAQLADEHGKPLVLVAVRGLDAAELGGAAFVWVDDREGLIAQIKRVVSPQFQPFPSIAGYEPPAAQPAAAASASPFDLPAPAPEPVAAPAAPAPAPAPDPAVAPAPTPHSPPAAFEPPPPLDPLRKSDDPARLQAVLAELDELAKAAGVDAAGAASMPPPVPPPGAAAAPMRPRAASPSPPPPPPPPPVMKHDAVGLSLANLARLRGRIVANPDTEPTARGDFAAAAPQPVQPQGGGMFGSPLEVGASRPPQRKMSPGARFPESAQVARRSRGPGVVLSGVALVLAAGGLAYAFRDQFANVVQIAARHAEKLLAVIGFIKGMPPPLPGLERPASAAADLVDCSVFTPPTVPRGGRFMVQVYLHLIDQAERVEFLATTMDEDARLKGRQTLQVPIARGARVRVELDGQGVKVDEAIQEIVWRGEPNVAAFSCMLPADAAEGPVLPVVRLFVDELPVGRVLFQIKAVPAATRDALTPPPQHAGLGARRYRYAFLSYASQDRVEVLKRAQALQVANIGFFQDLLSLEPGERYERKIYEKISEADLFMLFWSRHARASKWVGAEIDFARACQGRNPHSLPDIVPVVLDDPRDAPPPERLGDQHFNDTIAALISYEEHRPKGTGGFLSRWFGRG